MTKVSRGYWNQEYNCRVNHGLLYNYNDKIIDPVNLNVSKEKEYIVKNLGATFNKETNKWQVCKIKIPNWKYIFGDFLN